MVGINDENELKSNEEGIKNTFSFTENCLEWKWNKLFWLSTSGFLWAKTFQLNKTFLLFSGSQAAKSVFYRPKCQDSIRDLRISPGFFLECVCLISPRNVVQLAQDVVRREHLVLCTQHFELFTRVHHKIS